MERIETHTINPEVPETPEGKLALLRLCIDALTNGRHVEGITPRHVTMEGVHMLNRYRSNASNQSKV